MQYKEWMDQVQEGITRTTQDMNYQVLSDFSSKIHKAKRVFLMGQGRTGLVVEMFAMRLAQLGLPVFVVSQPTTPALTGDDLLVLVSGSGETAEILNAASKALEIGAASYAVTQNEDSSLGNLIECILTIPSPPKPTRVLNGTLFELALLITFDAVVAELLEITGQGYEEMSERHANIG